MGEGLNKITEIMSENLEKELDPLPSEMKKTLPTIKDFYDNFWSYIPESVLDVKYKAGKTIVTFVKEGEELKVKVRYWMVYKDT